MTEVKCIDNSHGLLCYGDIFEEYRIVYSHSELLSIR